MMAMNIFPFIHRLRADRSGASAAEFALIVPLLAVLIAAAIDFGGLISTRLQVASATHAGASYAAAQGFDEDAITTSITEGASIAVTAATPIETCGCPNAATGITVAGCGTTCPSGGLSGNYVTVSASKDYTLIYSWPGLSNPVNVVSTAAVRIP